MSLEDTIIKNCTRCGLDKTLSQFDKKGYNKYKNLDHRRSECKDCRSEYNKKKYQERKARKLAELEKNI